MRDEPGERRIDSGERMSSGPLEPDAVGETERKSRLAPLVVLGIALLLGLFEATRGYLIGRGRGLDYSWHDALIANLPWWLLWALLAPAVFYLARRFRLDRGSWRTGLLPHLAASVALSAVHIAAAGTLIFYAVTRGTLYMDPLAQVERLAQQTLVTDVITYWAILGAYYALVYSRRLRHEESERGRLAVRAAQLEARMTEARLAALRMELNPHFLFNALNAVSGLIQRDKPDRAVRMLARLGELFRQTLERGTDQEIRLEEELELLGVYLEIERIRFGDRLEVGLDVAPDTKGALVPSFILQPLVENAVRHGIASLPGPGRIDIGSRREGERLLLVIQDTGIGVVPGEERNARAGVGLSNSRARLAELYGEDWSLELRNRAEGGSELMLELPLRYAREQSHVTA